LASGFARLPLLAAALSRIISEGRQEQFDVLHGIWADEPGFLAVTAGRLLNTSTVVSVAGGELVGFTDINYGGQLSPINRWMTRRALYAAHQITVGSRLLAHRAAVHNAARLTVLPLGVDTSRFAPSQRIRQPDRNHRMYRLLHVASLVPVKDQMTLLRAFAQVVAQQPNVMLAIAGDGPLRQSLQTLSENLNLGAHVHFYGAVAHARMPELYQAADLCLLSSRHESQNLAILEAAACGTPAVGTAVGVLPELAPRDCTTPVGDASALATVILRLLRDDEQRRFLSETQYNMVQRCFALDRMVEKLIALYGQLSKTRKAL
jgi:glycosyltransferase involved in cell wall biosynthesis